MHKSHETLLIGATVISMLLFGLFAASEQDQAQGSTYQTDARVATNVTVPRETITATQTAQALKRVSPTPDQLVLAETEIPNRLPKDPKPPTPTFTPTPTRTTAPTPRPSPTPTVDQFVQACNKLLNMPRVPMLPYESFRHPVSVVIAGSSTLVRAVANYPKMFYEVPGTNVTVVAREGAMDEEIFQSAGTATTAHSAQVTIVQTAANRMNNGESATRTYSTVQTHIQEFQINHPDTRLVGVTVNPAGDGSNHQQRIILNSMLGDNIPLINTARQLLLPGCDINLKVFDASDAKHPNFYGLNLVAETYNLALKSIASQ